MKEADLFTRLMFTDGNHIMQNQRRLQYINSNETESRVSKVRGRKSGNGKFNVMNGMIRIRGIHGLGNGFSEAQSDSAGLHLSGGDDSHATGNFCSEIQKQEASFFSFSRLCITRQMYSAIAASRRKKHSPLNSYVSFYEDDEEKTPLIDTITARQETNPEEIFLSREYAQQLEARLEESLSDLEKRVLYLHLRGTDYKTIAKLLDKSPKTVDNALQRIKAKTQKILEKEKE